jgi:hypothetical protein
MTRTASLESKSDTSHDRVGAAAVLCVTRVLACLTLLSPTLSSG